MSLAVILPFISSFVGIVVVLDMELISHSHAALNKGMHPTENSAALIRKMPCLMRCVHGGCVWR